ncbi:metal ABC transporter ATP-binding protein [Anaerolineae bacterium CFX9]|nr:metal ABC transporter ATP-binding protein [Anaerolineae bacterium CFX9]
MAAISTTADPVHAHVPHKPAEARTILSVRDLCVRYGSGDLALENVSIDIREGERLAVIGPNGAGKSTLIKAIMGLLNPVSGTIEQAADLGVIGYVPQHEAVNWDFPVTVRDVVMMGGVRRVGWLRFPGKRDWDAVDQALRRVDLAALAHRQVGELSGGQRRRVFIARALAQQAKILILDEPFSGVDASAQADLMDMLDRLNREGLTIVLSTHDLDLAFHRFDRVLALRRTVIGCGAPDDVYRADVLSRLYERRIMAWHEGEAVSVFVDEHGCGDC